MSIEIRPIREEEFEAFTAASGSAFGFEPNPKIRDENRERLEWDRTLAALDGEEIVGTTAVESFTMTVPGGALPAAGVTWVSVKPTHRRRGVLTDLMRRQLSDVRERGEPLAVLWASESIIYGRFGYGPASEACHLEIEREHAVLAHAPPFSGRCRFVEREEALQAFPAVYDRVLPDRPGMYSRHQLWWRHKTLREADPERRQGARFRVLYEEDGEPLGYVMYRVRGGHADGLPDGTLGVGELIAATDGAYAALWQYLFGVDLIGRIEAQPRPVDEPLVWMLADPRRLVRRAWDALWARLVDVPAALEGRRYASEGRVVFDVRDAFCPWTEGRYALEGGPEGARCARTDGAPDVTLGAGELGALLLGGTRLSGLRRAGRVEGDEAAVRRADAMFSWDPLPWCPEVF